MTGLRFAARITPAAGTAPIDVTTPAADPFQARVLIEQIYGPVRAWWVGPQLIAADRKQATGQCR